MTKVYLVYVKASNLKEELEFEKRLNETKVVKGWSKLLGLKSGGNPSLYYE